MAEYVEYTGSEGPRMWRLGKFSFSMIEFQHLAAALVMITLTLMVHQRGFVQSIGVVNFIFVSVFTIGLGFLLHEFAHKLVAQHYGHLSEFRADFLMLFAMFMLAIVSPIILLAPGAVLIHGHVTNKQNGIISVAGPWVNLALGILFLIIGILTQPAAGTILNTLVFLGVWVNAFLGVFNMLPFWVLDGKKVLAWDKKVYVLTMGALVALLILGPGLL